MHIECKVSAKISAILKMSKIYVVVFVWVFYAINILVLSFFAAEFKRAKKFQPKINYC